MPQNDFNEPIRPSMNEPGARLLWYPLATIVSPRMNTKGKYADNYPRGAIVHFTAGRDQTERQAENTVAGGRENGYTFFVIGPEGEVYQAFPLDEWGYHAGESHWPGVGTSVSTKLVGIEITCAGKLDGDNKSWFGVTYPADQVRTVSNRYECPAGKYKKYTAAQEKALIDLLLWLKRNNPTIFSFSLVLGHHEVSGMIGIGRWRKNDPGGALSMKMGELRQLLEQAHF